MAKIPRRELHRRIEQLTELVDALQHAGTRAPLPELPNELDWEDAIECKLDHLHDDIRALRERAEIPRPECYAVGEPAPPTREDADRDGRT